MNESKGTMVATFSIPLFTPESICRTRSNVCRPRAKPVHPRQLAVALPMRTLPRDGRGVLRPLNIPVAVDCTRSDCILTGVADGQETDQNFQLKSPPEL